MKKDCFAYYSSATYGQYSNSSSTLIVQKSMCQDYSNRKGLNIINEFTDKGVSSVKDKRQLFEMIIACQESGVSTIITTRPERISRDINEYLVVKKILKKLNINIEFTNGDEYDEKLLSVYTSFNRRANARILIGKPETIMF